MGDTEKKENIENTINLEKNEEINDKKTINKKNEIKEEANEKDKKIEIHYIGNSLLAVMVVLILGTSALTYYLIHTEKNDYDKQYNEIVSNLPLNVINKGNENEEQPDSIANMIDGALANVTASNQGSQTTGTDSDSRKMMNEKLIVLYNGLLLDVSKMDEVALQYIDEHSEDKDKYVITYSSYQNYSFQESKLGTLSAPLYDGLLKVENVGKIAISEDYDAIPRNVKVINTIPTVISDNNPKITTDYDTVKTLIVDLDGNESNEYILILANKKTGFSKITLMDSKGAKVADLASIEKSKWNKTTNAEYYLSLSNLEVVDVDNDGIMEIVVEIPHYTGNPTISLLKYNNGQLQGKTGIECSLVAE